MKKYAGLFAALTACAALSATAFAEGDIVATLVDDDNITVELVSVEGDTTSGYTWNLHAVNKRDDEIQIGLDNALFNSLAVSTWGYIRLGGGEEADQAVIWEPSVFEKSGMTDITEVKCIVNAYDTTEYHTFTNTEFRYCPNGEDAVEAYVYTPAETDQVVVSVDGLTAYMIGTGEDTWGDFAINFFVQNESDSVMYLDTTSWKVNGSVDCNTYMTEIMQPHTSKFTSVTFSSYTFGDAQVDAIGTVDSDFTVTNWDSWEEIAAEHFAAVIDDSVDVTAVPAAPAEARTVTDEPVEPAEPVEAFAVDPTANVQASGADGKTWADFLSAN